MPWRLYLDVCVKKAVATGLRLREVDVLTAQEDGMRELSDAELLDRSIALGRLLFTHDADFLAIAPQRQVKNQSFLGLIFASQAVLVSRCLEDLQLLCKCAEEEELANRVTYLPF